MMMEVVNKKSFSQTYAAPWSARRQRVVFHRVHRVSRSTSFDSPRRSSCQTGSISVLHTPGDTTAMSAYHVRPARLCADECPLNPLVFVDCNTTLFELAVKYLWV